MSHFPTICLIVVLLSGYVRQSVNREICDIPILNSMGVCTPPNFCHDFYTERFYYRNLPVCEYGPSYEIRSICCPIHKTCSGSRSQIKCFEFHPFSAAAVPPDGYTVDDIKAEEKEFPHMAAVGFGTKPKIDWLCGGTIIDRRFVVTAAHCTTSNRGSPTWVRLGTLNISSPTNTTQDIAVARVYTHPKYKRDSVYNDIALLKLDRDIDFDVFYGYVKPACLQVGPLDLQTGLPYLERKLEATGWGRTSYLGERSYHLLKIDLDLVNYRKCRNRKWVYEPNGIGRGHICAGNRLGADTCQGDSGGPLHYKDYHGATEYFVLVGITSFGKGCGSEDAIGVYTKVSEYVTWIEDVVWPTEETVISFD